MAVTESISPVASVQPITGDGETGVYRQAKDLCVLGTVPNELRCFWTEETHELEFHSCCPVSNNPLPGSKLSITYEPHALILEVASLRVYIDSYRGGRGPVRSMEGMIQAIAQDCANILAVHVTVRADLLLEPTQKMKLRCIAFPAT